MMFYQITFLAMLSEFLEFSSPWAPQQWKPSALLQTPFLHSCCPRSSPVISHARGGSPPPPPRPSPICSSFTSSSVIWVVFLFSVFAFPLLPSPFPPLLLMHSLFILWDKTCQKWLSVVSRALHLLLKLSTSLSFLDHELELSYVPAENKPPFGTCAQQTSNR